MTQGEIADKISILEIKEAHGFPVSAELARYRALWRGKSEHLQILREVNKKTWDVQERLHLYIYGKLVNEKEELADHRRAHFFNKERNQIKNRINEDFGESQEGKTWNAFTN